MKMNVAVMKCWACAVAHRQLTTSMKIYTIQIIV